MDSNSNINFDFMALESNMTNGYASGANADLDQILSTQYTAPSNNGMFTFGSGFTPNGMNIDGGMGGNFAPNTMFEAGLSQGQLQYESHAASFPFPQQQVDPSAIMRPNRASGSETSQGSSEPSQQQEEIYTPKPKRTRQSKKKPLTKAQEEQKREEFLERNRVAAGKCRKRKQEQTQNLQETHQRLQHDNFSMHEEIRVLEAEVAQLRAILVGHRASGGCKTQQELESQIAYFESTTKMGSVYGSPRPGTAHSYGSAAFGSPATGMCTLNSGVAQSPYGVPMYRTNSAMSQLSINSRLGCKADGTPDLNPDWELKRTRKEQLARDEQYMESQEMSRQNSNASNSSKMTEMSAVTGNESGYTSAITTPEGEKPKDFVSGRRGRPRKLENPRGPQQGLVDPALQKVDSLQGLQNPVDFLAQQ